MNTTGRLARRLWWRLASLPALVALVVAPGAAGAHAPKDPLRVAAGTLAGDTTITWRGNVGITLKVPRKVSLPTLASKLYVSGGSYAFVRMYATHAEFPACAPFCIVRELSYIRAAADLPIYDETTSKPSPPGDDHFTTATSDPPTIDKMNRLEVYLMTDGQATLKLRPTGLGGRAAYVAGGKVNIAVRKLPATCVIPSGGPCDPKGDGYAGAITYGGVQLDVGPGGGAADVIAFHRNQAKFDQTTEQNHVNSVRVCLFPGPLQPFASPDPSLYPAGCNPTLNDSPDGDPRGTVQSVADESNAGIQPSYAAWNSLSHEFARGKQYIGWRIEHLGPPGGVRAAYGVWIAAGVGPPR